MPLNLKVKTKHMMEKERKLTGGWVIHMILQKLKKDKLILVREEAQQEGEWDLNMEWILGQSLMVIIENRRG